MAYTLTNARAAVKRMLDKPGNHGATEAVERLWPTLRKRLKPVDIEKLARIGLSFEVNWRQNADRSVENGSNLMRVVTVTRYGGDPIDVPVVFAQVRYSTETLEVKALLYFTSKDFRFVEAEHRKKAAGLIDVADFMAEEGALLEHHRAKTVADLPSDVRVALAERWPFRIVAEAKEAVA